LTMYPPRSRPLCFPYTTLFRSCSCPRTPTRWRRRGRSVGCEPARTAVDPKRSVRMGTRPTDHLTILERSGLAADSDSIESNNERSEEHTSELQSRENLVCRLLL